MNTIIVEKDISFSERLERDLDSIGVKVDGKTSSITDAFGQISRILPDCVICAPNLNENQSGLELASSVSHLRIPFIFIDKDSNKQNYLEAKRYPLGYYISRPFCALSLKSVLEECKIINYRYYSSHIQKGKYIFVKRNGVFEKINLNKISRLRSEGNYTIIYEGKRKFILKFSLSKLLNLPHFNSFFRIHRNFAIQKSKIIRVDFSNRFCETKVGKVPFGRTYTKSIREIMNLPYKQI